MSSVSMAKKYRNSGVSLIVGTLLSFAGIFSAAAGSSDTLSPLLTYKHYGEEDGLHCKTVYEVIQDYDGFLWFATDAGAFRFDGKTFKQYNIENGVTDKEVLKIFQDSYGRIWFLTLNGHLSFWKDGKIYNPANTPFLEKAYTGASIFSYYEDSQKRIWLGTFVFDFIVIDKDSVRIIKRPNDKFLYGYYAYEDAKGGMWRISDYKIFKFQGETEEDTILHPSRPLFVRHGKQRGEIFYWSEIDRKVYRIFDKTFSTYVDENEIPRNIKIQNMIIDQDGLWLCTSENGCYKIVNGKFSKAYLGGITVASVYRDREDNLWFNTMGDGVYMLSSNRDVIKNYNQQSGLSANNITSLTHGIEGELWLGYKNGNVEKIQNNKATIFKLISGKPDFQRVVCLARDSDRIVCGTDNGCYLIHNYSIERMSSDISPYYSVKQLFITKARNVFATHSSGMFQFIKINNKYFGKSIIAYTRTFAITEYPGEHLLVSTSTGLVEYNEKEIKEYKPDADLSSVRILDMKPVPANLLALATNGNGIYFLNGKKLYQHLSTLNGLSDNNCKRIFVSDNTLYVSTDKGLNVLDNTNGKWSVTEIISTKNGLLSNTVNDAAEHGGEIYVATEKGLSVFSKAALFSEKFISKVYITEIITDSANVISDSTYHFKSDIPRLFIRFSYPVFNPANDLKIKYRLVHSKTDNSEWITSSENNEVEFSSLNPGEYIFQLRPDAPTITDAGITNFYINIIPLWWQTTMARIAYALLAVGLITLFIRKRIQAQYKKQLRQLTMLEAERSRIASDMHDDIGADLTQISIWSGILKSSEKKDNMVVERITNSSNDVLQKMEQIIWALNSFQNHTSDLVVYLREFASQYLESAGIHLLLETGAAMPEYELSAIQKRNIFLVVKELLHNTVKHSGAKNVSIKIYHAHTSLYIEYNDDGKGFTPRVKEDGLGNITVQKRMKEINSVIAIKSSPGAGFSAFLTINLTKDNTGIKRLPDTFASKS